MSNRALHTRLIQLIEPVLETAGFELVDARLLVEHGEWTLRVQISLPLPETRGEADLAEVPDDRVDLSDCEKMSHDLSKVLDDADPIPQAYNLEVGSPGIDRPLRTAKHFTYYIGSDAKIALDTPLVVDGAERRNFRGILRGVDADRVSIDCDGQAFLLPIADIDSAKLVPDWDAVMRGKSGLASSKDHGKPVKPGHRPTQKPKPNKALKDLKEQ